MDDCLAATNAAVSTVPSVRHRLPKSVRQAARDGQRAVGMVRCTRRAPQMARNRPTGDVWQHHERLHSDRGSVAGTNDLALIEYVHAPILWSGSLRRFHRLDIALHALRDLRDDGCAAGLVIAADGQDRERLMQVASDLGVSAWVDFVGQISTLDMPSLLSCGDAAVVTAGADQAFHYPPLKLREYLAMALPVFAADIGEIGRVLDDGRSGLLYEPGDADGLASGLRRLAEDDELRARIGDAGRERVLESWTWDEITKRCLERLP